MENKKAKNVRMGNLKVPIKSIAILERIMEYAKAYSTLSFKKKVHDL